MNYGQTNAIKTDVDGFVTSPDGWSEEVAIELATAAGIESLTPEHWQVIGALRSAFHEGDPDLFPRLGGICESLGFEQECISKLFDDPLNAWQIAGLPKPANDLSAHMPSSKLA